MFSVSSAIAFLGLAFNLVSYGLYIRDMMRGQAKPNKVTVGLWFLQGAIAVGAAWSEGVSWYVLLPVLAGVIGPLGTFILSFVLRQAYWRLGFFDYACGASSLAALLLWYWTQNANVAIALAVLADFMAALPSVFKSWRYPDTESRVAWLLSVFGFGTSLLLFEQFTFAEMAYPLYAVAICALITLFIYTGPYRAGGRTP
ncbi:MAG: hypothetical protein AB7E52_08150 [Bdellovibrionales bacterium]